MSFAISVALLAAVVAVTCALPGTVLVLRRQAMMSDAMAHAVLPGIAVAAFVVGFANLAVADCRCDVGRRSAGGGHGMAAWSGALY